MDPSSTTEHSRWSERSSSRARAASISRLDAPLWVATALLFVLTVALWVTPYLPMVDLPQHATQLSIWVHEGDPIFAEPGRFVVNWRTPYLGAYLVARVLAIGIGVLPALKVVIWASVTLHLLAFWGLLEKLGHSRWLGLLGLPMALGYGFQYGFISFIGALPLGLFAITQALGHRERPQLRSGLWLAATLCAALATHGFMLGMTLAVVAPLLLRGHGRFFLRMLPLCAPGLFALVWLVPGPPVQSIGYTIWDPRLFDLTQAPALLVSASAFDHVASLFGVLFLTLVAVCLGRPRRAPEYFAPLAFMLLGYCLFPLMLGGFGPLHPRFVAFFVPCMLLAFEPRDGLWFEHLPTVIALSCVAWLALFVARLSTFTRETKPVRDFIAQMPRGLSIRPIVFEREGAAFPGLPVMLHLSAYYAAEKGGRQGYSFAMYPNSALRYRADVVPTMSGGSEWHPEYFSEAEVDAYDCILVRSTSDRSAELFSTRASDVHLAFHERDWWAYATPSFPNDTRANEKRD
jgi:hypothetical protein